MLSVTACILVASEGENPMWQDGTLPREVSEVAVEQASTTDVELTVESGDSSERMEPSADTETVMERDAAPVPKDDAFAISDDQQLGGSVLANDLMTEGLEPVTAVVQGPQNGTLTLGTDGLFTYTPDRGFSGTDTFAYRVAGSHEALVAAAQSDTGGGDEQDLIVEGSVGIVTIVVESSNAAPETASDSYTVDEDQSLLVDAEGVLENDTDADGDALTAVLVGAPAHGTVMLTDDGNFEYTPNANFFGTDSFAYAASDGVADSEPTIVDITVNAVNDAPRADDDSYTVREDETLVVETDGVLANDSDIDGDALTPVVVGQPLHGTVTLAEDGSFEYRPDADFHGADRFTYAANDGSEDSNLATVSIVVEAVNDAPVAGADAFSTREGETLVVDAPGVLANDSDVEGDALTAVLVDEPLHGTVTLAADGSFEYTPDADFNGTDRFAYAADDGLEGSQPTVVEITVTPIDLAIQLEVSVDAFTAGVQTGWAGSTFWVNAYVQDLRDTPQGVVGGAIDILFDAQLVAPTGAVVYGEAFDLFQQGRADGETGQIDETGAISTAIGVGVDGLAPFVAWEFVSLAQPDEAAAGVNVQFVVELGQGTETVTPADFALIGSGDPIAPEQVALKNAEADLYFADFNLDGAVDHFDLALWQPHAGTPAESPGYDPMYDLNADRAIDALDLDFLTAVMYQPTTWDAADTDADSDASNSDAQVADDDATAETESGDPLGLESIEDIV
jgi:VCBS repeat-containing protein